MANLRHLLARFGLPCLLLLVTLAGLGLASWDYLLQPSPHFHFIDLAESFMAGRLDTRLPERRKGGPQLPDDPPGLAAAVDRQLATGGWNDWSSYYEVALKSGDWFAGVWPWATRKEGQRGHDQKDRFVLLSGDWTEFDRNRDIRSACVTPVGERGSPERQNWELRERQDDYSEACEAATGVADGGRCPPGQLSVRCQLKRHYVSFPPTPALLMMPFVALWHYDFNDVIFTVVVATLNCLLLFLLLARAVRMGYVTRRPAELLLLALVFTFGTVNFFSAIRGEVWFTGLIVGVLFHLLYLHFALDLRHPLLAGLALGLGVATRVPLAFTFVFFALQLFLQKAPFDRSGLLLRLKQGTLFALPLLAIGGALMWYNSARFGSPFEFGHRYLLDGTRESIVDHGLFSFWFLPRNLAAAFTNVPQFMAEPPFVKISYHGLSLLATTPLLFFLFWPRRGGEAGRDSDPGRYRLSMHTMLWITVAATAIPGFLYQNSGWQQFGYRFGLDYLPLLFVLLALDRRRLNWLFVLLAIISVGVNLFGAVTFQRLPQFYH